MARGAVIGSRGGTTSRSGWVSRRLSAGQGGQGGAVQLASDPAELASNLAQEAADAVEKSFSGRIPGYLGIVRARWPVKTGYSAKQFRIVIRNVAGFFQLSIVNTADYSGWIRHKDERPTLVAVRLLFDPFSPVASEIARDIAEYLGD